MTKYCLTIIMDSTNQTVGDNGDAPTGATKEHPRVSKATKTIVNTKNDALHTPWLKGYMDDKKMFNTGIATARNKARYVTDTDIIGDMDIADDIHTIDGPERNRRRFYGIINKPKSDVLRSPPSTVTHTAAPARVGTLVEDMWPESINSNYLDHVSKKIVPPKNSIEAANRADAPMWKRAYKIERDILIKMGCFQYGFTLAERWGIHRSHFNRK